jgi:hypothetical protein
LPVPLALLVLPPLAWLRPPLEPRLPQVSHPLPPALLRPPLEPLRLPPVPRRLGAS